MTSMCVGNGHAGEGNESTRKGEQLPGPDGTLGELEFQPREGALIRG